MYSVGQREIVLRLYSFFGSLRRTALASGVSPASISRWSKRIHPLTRKRNAPTLAEAIRDVIRIALDGCACLTCTQLVAQIRAAMGVTVSKSLVLNVVHGLGYSFKRVKKRCVPKDASAHAIRTEQFLSKYRTCREEGKAVIVSVDESGFDHRARPFYGFAPRGKPAVVNYKACGDRKRYNLLMAISSTGRRAHHVQAGSVTSKTFADFVTGLPFPPGSILLLDNAAIHKARVVHDALTTKGYEPLFLPAYSPQFQPIELVFGRLKLAYYRERLQQHEQLSIASTVERLVSQLCDVGTVQRCFRHVDGEVMEHSSRSTT